jgi:hypothetical protein
MLTLVAAKSSYLVMINDNINNADFQHTINGYDTILGNKWASIDYLVINFGIHEIVTHAFSDSVYKYELCYLADSAKKYDKVVIWNQTTSLNDAVLGSGKNQRVIDFNSFALNILDSILNENKLRIVHQYDFQKADSMSYLWNADGVHYSDSPTAYPLFAAHTIASIDSQIISDSLYGYRGVNPMYYTDSVKTFYVGHAETIKGFYGKYPDSIKVRGTSFPSGLSLNSTTGIITWTGSGSTQSAINYTIRAYGACGYGEIGQDTASANINITISNAPSAGTRKTGTCNCIY